MPSLESYRKLRRIVDFCTQHHGRNPIQYSEPYPTKRGPAARETYNEIIDGLNAYLIETPVPIKTARPSKKVADESLGLVLSDLHFGKYSEIDNQVVYNLEIAKARFKKIVDVVKHLYADYLAKGHKIDDLHIFLVGDIIDGEQIYPTQSWNLEVPVIDQMEIATHTIGDQLIAWASATFENVYVHSVQGNHGEIRDGGSQVAFHWQTNFDTVLAKMLEIASRNLSNVIFDIGLDPVHIAKVPRHGKAEPWKFIMCHKMPTTRTTKGVDQKFGMLWGRHRWDMFLTGHWHNYSFQTWQGHPILFNGALFGSDDIYTAELGFTGFPSQTLFTIADSRPFAEIWPIQLDEVK